MKKNWSYAEIALLEAVMLLVLWLWNDYSAALITLIGVLVVFFVLLIALIAEWIEPSKVPRRYFWVALVLMGTALGVGLLYVLLLGGQLDFMDRL